MSTSCSLGQSLTGVSLLALLVTLAACASPTVRTQPTSTPANAPSPTKCPAGPPLDTFTIDATFGGGFTGGDVFVGRSPVWNLGLNTGESVSLESFPAQTVTSSSYLSTKVMWVVGPNYHQPVTLTGHDLSTGAPVWFDLSAVGSSPGNPMRTAVLDPANPNRGDTDNARGTWNIWGILLYFFAAGCYQITAAWSGGSWQIVVAV